MKDEQRKKLSYILGTERAILNLDLLSTSKLGSVLMLLDGQRREYYNFLYDNYNSDLDLNTEFKRYCDFMRDLVLTKKICRAAFAEIMRRFISNYQYISTLDENRECYKYTVETLDKLKQEFLKRKNPMVRNYGVEVMNRSKMMLRKHFKTFETSEVNQ